MPNRTQYSGIEQEIRSIHQLTERAIRVVEEHQKARELTQRLSVVRKEAILELRAAGWQWSEISALTGMSTKALMKAISNRPSSPGDWWNRLPEDIADSVKLGPGGMPRTQMIPKRILMEKILKVLAEEEMSSQRIGMDSARVAPGFIADRVGEMLGKPVPRPSLRLALYALIEEEKVERVAYGRYRLVARAKPRGAPAKKVARKSAKPASGRQRT